MQIKSNSAFFRLIKTQRLNIILFGLTIFIALAYFPLNQPHETVHSLNTALDSHISLQPIFSVPYLLFIPVFWLFFLLIFLKNRQFKALAITIIIVYVFSYIIYWFYQTKVTRPVILENDIFSRLVKAIYSHDNPYDAFPSLHSSLATVFALYFWLTTSKRYWRILASLFAGLVILSTLFVKQHYVIDAVGGAALGAIASWLVFGFDTPKIKPQKISNNDHPS